MAVVSRLRAEHAGEPAEDLADVVRAAWAAEGVALAEDQVAVWGRGISTNVGLDLTVHVQVSPSARRRQGAGGRLVG